jgi:hypothetical protein
MLQDVGSSKYDAELFPPGSDFYQNTYTKSVAEVHHDLYINGVWRIDYERGDIRLHLEVKGDIDDFYPNSRNLSRL